MNLEELEEELENILPPGFTIETDRRGRVVIHTNLQLEDGELVSADGEEEDDEEEEFDGDEDLEPLPDEDDD